MKTLKPFVAVFIITLSGFHFLLKAQEIEITASKYDVVSSITHLHKIFGHDEDHFYVIKFSGTQYFIEKLDRNLNPVIEEPIKLFKGLKTYKLEAIYHFYDEIYVFVSRTRLNDITLFYQRIDKGNLQALSDPVEITMVKNVKGAWADFHFALSRHETKLLVACRTKLSWSRAQFNELYVFGENLSLLWKRKDSFEFTGAGPRDNMYVVDETGNASVLSLLKGESIISLLRDYRNLYSIYRYTNQGNDFTEYPVTLEEKYIRGIKIIAGEQGDLVCAGLYSEMFKTGIRGTFFFKIDASTGQIYDHHLNGFDEAVLGELAALKEPIIKDEELINYTITDIVLRGEGKVMIIAEQVFHQSYNTFNNLIITSYDYNGQVYWARVISKNQNFNYTTIESSGVDLLQYRNFIRETGFMDANTDNYCSYALMAPLNKTGIILFYNDNIRNLEQIDDRKAFNQPKKSYVLAVAIDEFGNLTKTPLMRWKKKALFPQPMRYYDTLAETVVIPAFRNRNINYYKLTAQSIP